MEISVDEPSVESVWCSNGCVSFESSVDEPLVQSGRCSNGYVSFDALCCDGGL
jgi:hypothetical protein